MWFITLLVLAVAAVLIVKAVKAHSVRRSMDSQKPAEPTRMGTSERASENAASDRSPELVASSAPAPGTSHVTADDATARSAETDASGPQDDVTSVADIREMIRTLDLAESDAARLGISGDQFNALKGTADNDSNPDLPDVATRQDVAERLQRMLN